MTLLLDVNVAIALAVSRHGMLATFDRRLVANAVPGGRAAINWLLA